MGRYPEGVYEHGADYDICRDSGDSILNSAGNYVILSPEIRTSRWYYLGRLLSSS